MSLHNYSKMYNKIEINIIIIINFNFAKMVYIYVIQQEDGKFYIGKTDNPQFRLNNFNSISTEWTKLYRPLIVKEVIQDCDEYDVDKYTIKYMDKYGIDNVRGGSFCQDVLDYNTMTILEKMSKAGKTKCVTCGIVGVFSKECTQCSKCNSLGSIETCLKFIEISIQEKKRLELVDPMLEKPTCGNNFEWGSFQENLLHTEKKRARLQKEKNDEYLPIFEVMYKALQYLHKK